MNKTLKCSECGEEFDFDSHEHICKNLLREVIENMPDKIGLWGRYKLSKGNSQHTKPLKSRIKLGSIPCGEGASKKDKTADTGGNCEMATPVNSPNKSERLSNERESLLTKQVQNGSDIFLEIQKLKEEISKKQMELDIVQAMPELHGQLRLGTEMGLLQAKLETWKQALTSEINWLEKYFKNQRVYLPDLDVYATKIIQDRIAELKGALE